MNAFSSLILALVLVVSGQGFSPAVSLAGIPLESDLPIRTVNSRSTEDIFSLFDSVGYTAEAWQQGLREIPRIYMTSIPKRWKTESGELSVARKKEIFFRLLAPVVLRTNELIFVERNQLQDLMAKYPNLGPKEENDLLSLARKYKVIDTQATLLEEEQLQELQLRIDIIPPSLALAQGAEESGWGTSRFALLGNSLFGQWDFSGRGIKPARQRTELGDYGLAAFDTPLDAVAAYARNLNTHRAYTKLRAMRAKIRGENRKPTGHELAGTLDKYSERGQAYIDGLRTIMRVNKLAPTDEAWLWNKSVILIQPAE